MWLQADGLEALDRALLLQLRVELDRFVVDLQSFVFPAPHSRAPSNQKCASGHCTTPFLYPRWGNTATNTVDNFFQLLSHVHSILERLRPQDAQRARLEKKNGKSTELCFLAA